jgi:hypothetical protein
VTPARKRWKAQIQYDSKHHFLGTFATKQEAALAYDREARQCGKDKPLNYESTAAAEAAAVTAAQAPGEAAAVAYLSRAAFKRSAPFFFSSRFRSDLFQRHGLRAKRSVNI